MLDLLRLQSLVKDDPTAIRSSGTELVQTRRDWKQWSVATRLQENLAKLQLMGQREAQQNEIRNACVEQGIAKVATESL